MNSGIGQDCSEPIKVNEIPSVLNDLESQIEFLQKSVSLLFSKIGSIIRQEPTAKETVKDCIGERSTDLSNRIQRLVNSICDLNKQTQEQINKIEL